VQALYLSHPVGLAGYLVAELATTPKCADAASPRAICPMREPDGRTCPMHRTATGQPACRLTSACSRTESFLGVVLTPFGVPTETPAFSIPFASVSTLETPYAPLASLVSPPDAPPPRAE